MSIVDPVNVGFDDGFRSQLGARDVRTVLRLMELIMMLMT